MPAILHGSRGRHSRPLEPIRTVRRQMSGRAPAGAPAAGRRGCGSPARSHSRQDRPMPTARPLQVEPVGIDQRPGACADRRSPSPRHARAAARPSAPAGGRRCGRSRGRRRRPAARRPAPAPSPGWRRRACTTQRGQEPPKRANGKPAAEKRLETLPAGSTRRKKNGTPRAPGRCSAGQPVARLLEGHAEPRRQRLHVVAQRAARRRGTARRASAARRRRSSAGRRGSAPPPPASSARSPPAPPPPRRAPPAARAGTPCGSRGSRAAAARTASARARLGS